MQAMEDTVASNDDKQKRGKDPTDKRPAEEQAKQTSGAAGREETSAGQNVGAPSELARNTHSELTSASRDYQRAVYQAWLRAAEEYSKADFELAAAQHRLMQQASAQRAQAYFKWLNVAHEIGSKDTSSNDALKDAYDSCVKSYDEAGKAEREAWNAAHHERQRVLAAASEGYAQSVDSAVGAYLSRFRTLWNGIDFSAADPQTVSLVTAASAHATQLTQAAPRKRA
jgi:hypothetical protein